MSAVGPRACNEWLVLFQRFGSGDDTTLAEMQHGAVELVGRERARWCTAVTSALQQRLRRLSTRVGKRFALSVTAGDVSAVLGWTRAQVSVLYCFSRVPAFPKPLRAQIERSCRRWIEQTQVRLERGAARSHDQELRLLTVRRSRLLWPPLTSTC